MLEIVPVKSSPKPLVQPMSQWKAHTDFIQNVVVLPDNDSIITCSKDGKLLLSSIKQAGVVRQIKAQQAPINTLALTPNGKYLITGSDDTTVRVWDTNAWKVIHTFTEHNDYVRSVAATNNTIVSGAEDKLICVWDIATGNCLHKLTGHAEEYFHNVTLLMDLKDV